jgi:hypothetical protein
VAPSGINPDIVPVGFAATEGPGAPARRHRPRWLLAVAIVLGVGGVAALAVGVSEAFGGSLDVDGRAVARGRVAALGSEQWEPATFTAPAAGRYTVWLRTDGISEEGSRDVVVAATSCRAELADGTTSTFRGAVQGSSVTIGDRATVGTFVAPAGEVEVICRMQPFGRRSRYERLREERDIVVVPGGPGGGFTAVLWILGGTAAVTGAVAVGLRWRAGGLRPR